MTGTLQFTDPVSEAAQRWAGAPAVTHPEGTITFGGLARLVHGTARAIAASTSAPYVGLVPAATWKSVVMLLALIRARRVTCLFSSRWPHATIARAIRQSGHTMPVLEPDDVEELVCAEDAPSAPPTALLSSTPVTVVFTTGSTGEPKAVLHSAGNHLLSARGANTRLPLSPGDRWLLALPLYHVGGMAIVFRCLMAGSTIVLPSAGDALAASLHRHACTHVSLVPTQLHRLLRGDDRYALPHLRTMLVGGSAAPLHLLLEASARKYPVSTTYGLTEMSSLVTTLPPDAGRKALASSGRMLPYRAVRIAESGEILVRGPVLFQGYVHGGGVHLPLTQDGWFATRDLGRMGDDHCLYVEGRKDNMFISGGENVVPEEIERALCSLRGVKRAIVVPVRDEVFGARPVAFVAGDSDWDRFAYALEKVLPRFKVPVFLPWPEVTPRIGAKVDRDALRRWAEMARKEASEG